VNKRRILMPAGCSGDSYGIVLPYSATVADTHSGDYNNHKNAYL
jgi:hypothetical protein